MLELHKHLSKRQLGWESGQQIRAHITFDPKTTNGASTLNYRVT